MQFHLIILHERWRVSFQSDVGGSGAELLGEWLTVGQPRFSRSVTFPPTAPTTLPYILFRVHPLPKLNLTLRFHLFSSRGFEDRSTGTPTTFRVQHKESLPPLHVR